MNIDGDFLIFKNCNKHTKDNITPRSRWISTLDPFKNLEKNGFPYQLRGTLGHDFFPSMWLVSDGLQII